MRTERLRAEYEAKSERYERLGAEISNVLRRKLSDSGIPYQQITARVKEFGAFVRKAHRLETCDPFGDVTDICEVMVICLLQGDLPRIGEIIESSFDIRSVDDRVSTDPSAFGYLSVHYAGYLPEGYPQPGNGELNGLQFEIQVRTVTMQTWATMLHHLHYKSALAVPSHLSRDFHALAALLYAADKHFEALSRSRDRARQTADEKAGTASLGTTDLDYNTLAAYLLSRYKDRKRAEPEMLSLLIDELQNAGYKTIGHLNDILERTRKAFEAFETDHAPEGQEWECDAGVVRVSMGIGDGNYLANSKAPEEIKRVRRAYRHLVE